MGARGTYTPIGNEQHLLKLLELRDLTTEQLLDGARNQRYKGSAAALEILTRVTKQIDEMQRQRQGSEGGSDREIVIRFEGMPSGATTNSTA